LKLRTFAWLKNLGSSVCKAIYDASLHVSKAYPRIFER